MMKTPDTAAKAQEGRVLQNLRRGEPSALDEVYDLYADKLYHYLLTLLRSDSEAEEVLQNMFLKLARNPSLVVSNLAGYLFTSARNEATRFMRKRHLTARREADLRELAIIESPGGDKRSLEEAEQVNLLLSKLPAEQMEAVVLRVYEELTYREMGEVLGIPLDTARSRYQYGIDKLRDLLGKHKG